MWFWSEGSELYSCRTELGSKDDGDMRRILGFFRAENGKKNRVRASHVGRPI